MTKSASERIVAGRSGGTGRTAAEDAGGGLRAGAGGSTLLGLWLDEAGLRRVEAVLVWLIAAHTVAVGCGLLLAPAWSLRFGGWQSLPDPFFPAQAGIFHFVLAAGYLVEYSRHRTVTLIVIAKSLAVVFLLTFAALSKAPWFIAFAGVADGLMAAVAYAVNRRVARLADRG